MGFYIIFIVFKAFWVDFYLTFLYKAYLNDFERLWTIINDHKRQWTIAWTVVSVNVHSRSILEVVNGGNSMFFQFIDFFDIYN